METGKYLNYFKKAQYQKHTAVETASTNQNLCASAIFNQSYHITNSTSSVSSSNHHLPLQNHYQQSPTPNSFSQKKLSKHKFHFRHIIKNQNSKLITKSSQQKRNPSLEQGKTILQNKFMNGINQQKYPGNQKAKTIHIYNNQSKVFHDSFSLSKTLKLNQTKALTLQSEPLKPIRPYNRNKTAPNKKFKSMKTTFGDLNSSCKNYNDHYTISLQNLRMGWRILNTKSMVEEYRHNPHFSFQIYNGKFVSKEKSNENSKKHRKNNDFGKERSKNVIKAFFKASNLSIKQQRKRIRLVESFSKKHHNCENVLIEQEKGHSSSKQFNNVNLNPLFDHHIKKDKKFNNHSKPSFFKDRYFLQNRSFNKNNFLIANRNHQSISNTCQIKTML